MIEYSWVSKKVMTEKMSKSGQFLGLYSNLCWLHHSYFKILKKKSKFLIKIARRQRLLTSRVHFPMGYSAQVCDVMKGHLVKPSLPSSSCGRLDRIIDRVPMGDLR